MYSTLLPSKAESFTPPSALHGLPLDRGDKREAALLGESLLVKARQAIFMEGDRAHFLFKVVSGVVRTYKILACGRRQLTGFLFEGDFFGCHHADHYHATAEAITDTTVIRYRLHARRNSVSAAAWAGQTLDLMREVALSELRGAEEQVLLLGRMSSCSKVAAFLLYLSERAQSRGEAANPVDVPMTRYDIADFLGLTAESVSRSLTRLKQAGMIAIETSDEITLLDPLALSDVPRGF